MQLALGSGDTSVVAMPDAGTQFGYPQALPGSEMILVTVAASSSVEVDPTTGDLYVLSPATGEQRLLLRDAVAGQFLPTGHLVFLRSSALWAVPFDQERVQTLGTPVPVVEGVRLDSGLGAQFAISDDGSLAYVPVGASGRERRILTVDRNGREAFAGVDGSFESLDLSPDGRHLLLGTSTASGNADVWVSDLNRGDLVRLTTDPAFDGAPLWGRDGQRVVFTTMRNGRPELMWMLADGSGTPETLATFDEGVNNVVAYDFVPDGKTLLVAAHPDESVESDIGLVTIGDPRSWRPLVETPARERMPTVSPNGRWLAYASNESGSFEVYVESFPDLGNKTQVSIDGGHTPRWTANGQAIVYLHAPSGPPEAMMHVAFEDSGDARASVGAPQVLFDWRYFIRPGGMHPYALSDMGDQFFVVGSKDADEAAPSQAQINVVLDWFSELTELVPIP